MHSVQRSVKNKISNKDKKLDNTRSSLRSNANNTCNTSKVADTCKGKENLRLENNQKSSNIITKSINLNLMSKFEKVKKTLTKRVDKTSVESNEEVLNEILNKINTYKQTVNFKDELNNVYLIEVQIFIDSFMRLFNSINISKEEDASNTGNLFVNNNQLIEILMTMKELFSRIENLFYSNLNLLHYDEKEIEKEIENEIDNENNYYSKTKQRKDFVLLLDNLFSLLDEKINLYSFDAEISAMIDKINDIKSFVIKSEINFKNKFPSQESNKENNLNFKTLSTSSSKKIEKKTNRKDVLLDTAYMKKTKSRYGMDDEIVYDEDFTTKNNEEYNKIMKKNKKLFLRNFLQIFLMKDDGIFSESFFSKIDKSLLNSYKNFTFYEIKFYFSIEESFRDMSVYLENLRNLFPRYIMMYKELHKSRFIKITICGVGKKQSLMKRQLINILSGDVKLDCLFKIALFSNIFDCMTESLRKISRKKNYFFYTNFTNSMLWKIIKKTN